MPLGTRRPVAGPGALALVRDGARVEFLRSEWIAALHCARARGWQPRGTDYSALLPRVPFIFGYYLAPDGQAITGPDASALASALCSAASVLRAGLAHEQFARKVNTMACISPGEWEPGRIAPFALAQRTGVRPELLEGIAKFLSQGCCTIERGTWS